MNMNEERLMPNSNETERRVLTGIMIYEDVPHIVFNKLSPECFYNIKNKLIYDTALDLFRKGKVSDLVTLSGALDGKVDLLELSEIATDYVSEDLLEQDVESLLDLHTRRQLIYLRKQTDKAYSNANDVSELLSEISGTIDNIGATTDNTTKKFSEIFSECMEQHEFAMTNTGSLNGINTGFRGLNRLNNGWGEGELIILAGRPAMGKTTLALNFMLEAIRRDKKVAMFSMEMTTKELGQKLMSVITGIDTDRIKLGQCSEEELQMLHEQCSPIINSNSLTVDDNGSMDIHKLKSTARKLKATNGLDMIVVDYLQLLNGNDKSLKGGSREQQISFLSRSLKALAKDLNIPIICLSQLSRALESREDKRPMLSDLRESGAIEQDANQVLFVYREAYYTKDDSNKVTEVIIGKNRSGRTGAAQLEFDGAKSTFKEHIEEFSMISNQ